MTVKPGDRCGVVAGPAIGLPSTWAGMRESEEGEDRGSRVNEIGFQVTARGEARAGQGDDSLGPVRSGEIGVGLEP